MGARCAGGCWPLATCRMIDYVSEYIKDHGSQVSPGQRREF